MRVVGLAFPGEKKNQNVAHSKNETNGKTRNKQMMEIHSALHQGDKIVYSSPGQMS